MTDDTKAACRAALLKACHVTDAIIGADREGVPIESVCVDVDDAAALMAEREAKLRGVLERLNEAAAFLIVSTPSEQVISNGQRGFPVDGEAMLALCTAQDEAEAALAAAQAREATDA